MDRQEKIRTGIEKGFKLFKAGKLQGDPFKALAAFASEEVPDCTVAEFKDAIAELMDDRERQTRIAETLKRIGQRHDARQDETMTELVNRAAKAGDEEALALLADYARN
jgi:hypothetical protein